MRNTRTNASHRTPARRTALLSVLALAGALVLGFTLSGSDQAISADRGGGLAASSGVFVGSDDAGQFQLALEDAVQKAAAAAGCCDIRISYEVVETTGQHGGFLFVDDIFVKILAEW